LEMAFKKVLTTILRYDCCKRDTYIHSLLLARVSPSLTHRSSDERVCVRNSHFKLVLTGSLLLVDRDRETLKLSAKLGHTCHLSLRAFHISGFVPS